MYGSKQMVKMVKNEDELGYLTYLAIKTQLRNR